MPTAPGETGRLYEWVTKIVDTESDVDRNGILPSAFTVSGPDGSTLAKTVTIEGEGRSVTARVRFIPTKAGTHSLTVVDGRIKDLAGNAIAARPLETAIINTAEVITPGTESTLTYDLQAVGVPPGWITVNVSPSREDDYLELSKVSGPDNWGLQYMRSPVVNMDEPVILKEISTGNTNHAIGIHEDPDSWISTPSNRGFMLKSGDGKLFYGAWNIHTFPAAAEGVEVEMRISRSGDDGTVEVFHDGVTQGTYTQTNAFGNTEIDTPMIVLDAAYHPVRMTSAQYKGTAIAIAAPVLSPRPNVTLKTTTEPYNLQFANTGGFALSWEITNLPTGWTYNTVNGLVSATPTAVVAPRDITIKATNAVGSSTITTRLEVELAPPRVAPVAAIRLPKNSSQFEYTFSDLASTSGVTWSVTGAPAGWALDASSAKLTGPLNVDFDSNLSIKATNTAGESTLSLPLEIATAPTGTTEAAASANFEALTALPANYTTDENVTTDFVDGWLKVSGSSRNYKAWVSGPILTYREGDRFTFNYRTNGLTGVGLSAKTSNLGGFQVDDSLVHFSHNQGNFTGGDTELVRGIGHDFSKYYRMTLSFNDNAVDLLIEEETTAGNYTVKYFDRVGVPGPMFSGLRPVFIAYNGNVWIKSFLHERTQSPPDGGLLQRSIPSGFMGYNSSTIIFADWDDVNQTILQATMNAVGTGYLRFTGDEATYGYIGQGLIQNGADVFPDTKYNTPNNMPPWLAYRTNRTGGFQEIKKMTGASGIERQGWTVNTVLGTPAGEVARCQAAIAAGHSVDVIEFGNELYIPNLNYMGDDDHPIGFRTPEDYAIAMRDDWIPAFRTAFPNAKLLLIGVSDTGQINERFRAWMPALIDNNAFKPGGADGISLHPYYYITDIGLSKASVGDRVAAGAAGLAAFERFRNIVNGFLMGGLPPGLEIYVTEYGLLEDITQTGFVVVGQSWLHGVIMAMSTLIMWADPRIQGSAVHSLIGNPQWAAVHDQAGVAVDPAKRGVDDEPWTAGLADPLSPTLMGIVLGIVENEVAQGGGNGLLLANADGLIAWRIVDGAKNKIVAVNVGASSKSFTLPTGTTWVDKVWTNDPWLTLPDVTDLADPTEGTGKTGSYAIAGFTLSILTLTV